MDKISIKEIFYSYAKRRGGGLPLTAEEMCNAIALWVQEYVKTNQGGSANFNNLFGDLPIIIERSLGGDSATIKIDVNALSNLFEGSETVVVDLNETNDKIEIHIDSEIVAKLDRAILTPLQRPTELVLPIVTQTGKVVYEPVRSFSGDLYAVRLKGFLDTGYFIEISFYTKTTYGTIDNLLDNMTDEFQLPCSGYIYDNDNNIVTLVNSFGKMPVDSEHEGEVVFYGYENPVYITAEALLGGVLYEELQSL